MPPCRRTRAAPPARTWRRRAPARPRRTRCRRPSPGCAPRRAGASPRSSARGTRSAKIQLAPELAEITSAVARTSSPSASASASASAAAARFDAASRLLTIFVPAASPTRSEIVNVRPAIAANTSGAALARLPGTGHHDRHRSGRGPGRTARDRRVEDRHARGGDAGGQAAHVVRIDGRRDEHGAVARPRREDAVGSEQHLVDLGRVDDDHDDDRRGAGDLGRRSDAPSRRQRPRVRPPPGGCRARPRGSHGARATRRCRAPSRPARRRRRCRACRSGRSTVMRRVRHVHFADAGTISGSQLVSRHPVPSRT